MAEYDDLEKRLRECGYINAENVHGVFELMDEAADAIAALQARVEAAEKASQQLREQIDLVARDMEILEQERDAALALSKISREDLKNWWDQCVQGLFTDHGDCPATYACSSILSDLRDIDPTLDAAQSGEQCHDD